MDEERRRLIMGIILVFFMVSSVFGVFVFGFNDGASSTSQRYNGHKFTIFQNQWKVELNGEDKLFDYYPEDVDYIPVDSAVSSAFSNAKMVYFTSDVDSAMKGPIAKSTYDFNRALVAENIHVVTAFTEENEFNLPVVTCAEATPTVPVVMLVAGDTTSVSTIGNCIVLTGDSDYSFSRLSERILYGYYGVIA